MRELITIRGTIRYMDTSKSRPRSEDRRQRLATMAELVLDRGSISIDELAERYAVSTMTVYRDLAELEKSGIVSRTRGQVVARATSFSEASVTFRSQINTDVKSRLAQRAIEEVYAGSTIMLDDSTSVLGMVGLMEDIGPVTLITHSQSVAREAAGLRSLRLFVTGGRYRPEFDSLYGSTALSTLRSIRADVCFMSTMSIQGGELFHPLEENSDIKQAMLASSNRAVLVVDSSKFGHGATYRFSSIHDFDLVIVDGGIPADELAIIDQAGVEIAIVDQDPA